MWPVAGFACADMRRYDGAMGPIAAIGSAVRHAHHLKRRAPRSEYWWIVGSLIAGVILATIVDSTVFAGPLRETGLYGLATVVFVGFYVTGLILTLSVTIRRLRDLDMSLWFLLIYLLPVGLGFLIMGVICSQRGTHGPNQFGPDPLYVDRFEDVDVFG